MGAVEWKVVISISTEAIPPNNACSRANIVVLIVRKFTS